MPQPDAPAKADGFVRTFLAIGLMSFGGPAGQIATMHRELVERRRWLDDATFLAALNFCMLLPGPEAQQLATWAGWRRRGVAGGLVAGLLFIAPGALVMAVLAAGYIAFGALAPVRALFAGVQAAVLAVVAAAVLRMARRVLKGPRSWALALAAFAAITVLAMPFPLVVALAAVVGGLGPAPAVAPPPPVAPPSGAALRTLALGALVWLAPLAAVALWRGPGDGLVDLGGFFARLALASFGGAYAGLAYVAQAAAGHGWVTPGEIVDGLALAETTPGPLVLVYQFVGALAGHRLVGGWEGPVIGMALVLWLTFAPSFVFILALAPQLDRLLAQPRLAGALAGVSAAVVGVMASLAVWFGLHVLFGGVAAVAYGPLRLWQPVGPVSGFAAAIALLAALWLAAGRGLAAALALAAAAGLLRWSAS